MNIKVITVVLAICFLLSSCSSDEGIHSVTYNDTTASLNNKAGQAQEQEPFIEYAKRARGSQQDGPVVNEWVSELLDLGYKLNQNNDNNIKEYEYCNEKYGVTMYQTSLQEVIKKASEEVELFNVHGYRTDSAGNKHEVYYIQVSLIENKKGASIEEYYVDMITSVEEKLKKEGVEKEYSRELADTLLGGSWWKRARLDNPNYEKNGGITTISGELSEIYLRMEGSYILTVYCSGEPLSIESAEECFFKPSMSGYPKPVEENIIHKDVVELLNMGDEHGNTPSRTDTSFLNSKEGFFSI